MADDIFSSAAGSGGSSDIFSMAGGSSSTATASAQTSSPDIFSTAANKANDIFSTASTPASDGKFPLNYQDEAAKVFQHQNDSFNDNPQYQGMKAMDNVDNAGLKPDAGSIFEQPTKTFMNEVGTNFNRFIAAPAGAVEGAIRAPAGQKLDAAIQGGKEGFTSDSPRGVAGVISAASGIPYEQLPWYDQALGAYSDMALNPLNALEFGALTGTGKAAEKTADLTGTVGGDAAKGYRSAASLNLPFVKNNVPLMPQSASSAVLGGVSKAVKGVSDMGRNGETLGGLFDTSAGLSPDLAKSKSLNYTAKLNELEQQHGDLLRQHQDVVNSVAQNSGLTPQQVHDQVLRYNETTDPVVKKAMADQMHTDVKTLADARSSTFDQLYKGDQKNGLVYPQRTTYEPHNPTSQFYNYLAQNPDKRAVFNQKHGASIPREVSGSIQDNNALTQAGTHPNYPGFKGKMFNDDISQTLADRAKESGQFEITRNFFKQVTDQHGMTPENYEKALEDGTVKKGYFVPMTSKAFGQSQLTDAAGKTRTVNNTMMLPPDIKANLSRTENLYNKSIMDAIKPINAAWRPWQISSIANFVRDVMVAYPKNAWLAQGIHPVQMLQNFARVLPKAFESAGWGKGLGDSLQMAADGRKISGPELMSELRQSAFTKGTMEGMGDLDKVVKPGQKLVSPATQANPLNPQNWKPMIDQLKGGLSEAVGNLKQGGIGYAKAPLNVVQGLAKAVQTNPGFAAYRALRGPLENAMRGAYYLALREGKGFSKDAATLETGHAMYNWNDLTPFQKNVMREVEPFAVWGIKNIPFQLEQMLKNPGKALAVQRFSTSYGGPQQNAESRFYSDWQTRGAPFRTGGQQPSSIPNNSYLANEDPTYNINEIAPTGQKASDFANPLNWAKSISNYNEGQLTPALSLPWELMTNYDNFTKAPIQSYPGQQVPYMGMAMSPITKKIAGEFGPSSFIDRVINKPAGTSMARSLLDLNTQPFDVNKAAYWKEKALKTGDQTTDSVEGLKMEQRKEQRKLNDPASNSLQKKVSAHNLDAISARLGALIRGANPEAQ